MRGSRSDDNERTHLQRPRAFVRQLAAASDNLAIGADAQREEFIQVDAGVPALAQEVLGAATVGHAVTFASAVATSRMKLSKNTLRTKVTM